MPGKLIYVPRSLLLLNPLSHTSMMACSDERLQEMSCGLVLRGPIQSSPLPSFAERAGHLKVKDFMTPLSSIVILVSWVFPLRLSYIASNRQFLVASEVLTT